MKRNFVGKFAKRSPGDGNFISRDITSIHATRCVRDSGEKGVVNQLLPAAGRINERRRSEFQLVNLTRVVSRARFFPPRVNFNERRCVESTAHLPGSQSVEGDDVKGEEIKISQTARAVCIQ